MATTLDPQTLWSKLLSDVGHCSKNNHILCSKTGNPFFLHLSRIKVFDIPYCLKLLTERIFYASEAIACISNVDFDRFLHILDSIWLNTLDYMTHPNTFETFVRYPNLTYESISVVFILI